jgi:hypothetical protein
MSFPFIPLAMALSQFAPSISKWMQGDQADTLAQKCVEIASRLTGVDEPLENFKVLQENPALAIEFQRDVLKLEAQMEAGLLLDRQNARLRDLRLIQAGRRNRRADIMVVSAALGLVLCLVSLTYFGQKLPGEAVGILSTIAGIFGACLKDAYAFEFGSSRSSRDKDTTVATLLERMG